METHSWTWPYSAFQWYNWSCWKPSRLTWSGGGVPEGPRPSIHEACMKHRKEHLESVYWKQMHFTHHHCTHCHTWWEGEVHMKGLHNTSPHKHIYINGQYKSEHHTHCSSSGCCIAVQLNSRYRTWSWWKVSRWRTICSIHENCSPIPEFNHPFQQQDSYIFIWTSTDCKLQAKKLCEGE
jgi:hypothetical protein